MEHIFILGVSDARSSLVNEKSYINQKKYLFLLLFQFSFVFLLTLFGSCSLFIVDEIFGIETCSHSLFHIFISFGSFSNKFLLLDYLFIGSLSSFELNN